MTGMNETAITAQFALLCDQRNAALNSAVNLAGELATAKASIAALTAQLEAATSLISDNATEVENPNA